MNLSLGDSRTMLPFKAQRTGRKEEHESFRSRLMSRLGWRKTNTTSMKQVKLTVSVVAGGKPRKKGEILELPDLKAAELIGMRVATLEKDLPQTKRNPWEIPAEEREQARKQTAQPPPQLARR